MEVGVRKTSIRVGATILDIPESRWGVYIHIRNPFVLVVSLGFYYLKFGY